VLKWCRIRDDNGGVEYHSTKNNVVIKKSGKKWVCTYLDYGKLSGDSVKELKTIVQWVLSQKKNKKSGLQC